MTKISYIPCLWKTPSGSLWKNLSPEKTTEGAFLYGQLNALLCMSWHTQDETDLKELYKAVTAVEFALQDFWGFERNINFHHYSFRMKGCTCPQMDNEERIGTGQMIHNGDCIYHGIGDRELFKEIAFHQRYSEGYKGIKHE